jgi:hypothetical protein
MTSQNVADQQTTSSHRMDELKNSCALLADGFNEFDDMIETYVQEVPLQVRDSESRDCDRFLLWLEQCVELSDEQRDFIINQQSRHAVEFVALKQRIAHSRFQEMARDGVAIDAKSAKHLANYVHLNPVHVWATFETHAFLDEETPVPATVLFYPANDEICTAVVSEGTKTFLRNLERGPLKLKTLIRQTPKSDRESLLVMINQLIKQRVIAIAN